MGAAIFLFSVLGFLLRHWSKVTPRTVRKQLTRKDIAETVHDKSDFKYEM